MLPRVSTGPGSGVWGPEVGSNRLFIIFTIRMVGGHNTNMAAAVRRFITNQPPLSTLQWPLKNPSVIQSQFSSALRGQEPFLCKLLSITIISWVNFPFPASSLHLSSQCSSWCSEYILIAWVSAATQGPVVRGNTHHRFSIYPLATTSLPISLAS